MKLSRFPKFLICLLLPLVAPAEPAGKARFNAATEGAVPKPQQLIAGVKSFISWKSEIQEPSMNVNFPGVKSAGKLVFAAIPPNYPLTLALRFPEARRFCSLPDSFDEEMAPFMEDDAMKPGFHMQASLYDFDRDGTPELIVAVNQWDARHKMWEDQLKVLVYTFHAPKSEAALDDSGNWKLAGKMKGQFIVVVEGGTLILPIGSKSGNDYSFKKGKFVKGKGMHIDPSGRWKADQ